MISDARSMDRTKSLDLLKFYFEVQREILELDDTFLDLLKTSEGDVLSKMKSRMERMESRDCVVLVAGKSMHVLQHLERYINNSLHLARKYARILSADITCSEKRL